MRALWVSGVLAALATPGWACEVTEPLVPADFAADTVVLAGVVTDYRTDGVTEVFSFTPDFPLKGDLPEGAIQITIDQTMGTVLLTPRPGDRVIAGVTPGDAQNAWRLTAPLCGTAHLLPETMDNWENIALALIGEEG